MNYKRLYDSIIQTAQARAVTEGYTERHHILPRSMGGDDVASNLVVLTAREHYLAHYCLAKFTTGKDKASMVFGFNCMNNGNPTKKRYINSRLYTSLRVEHSNILKAQSGKNHPSYGTHPTAEQLAKITKASQGKNNGMYGKTHTLSSLLKNTIANIQNGIIFI